MKTKMKMLVGASLSILLLLSIGSEGQDKKVVPKPTAQPTIKAPAAPKVLKADPAPVAPVVPPVAPEPGPVAPPVPHGPITLVGPTTGDPDSEDETVPDGTKGNPYIYTLGSKGKLVLSGVEGIDAKDISWLLSDAPSDNELWPDKTVLWFPTDVEDTYQIYAGVTDRSTTTTGPILTQAWIKIQGPTEPGARARLATDVKKGFTGPDAKKDALAFQKAIDALNSLLVSGDIKTTEQMIGSFKKGLDSVGWQAHKYPAITQLFGTNFGGPTTPGHDLTPTEITDFKDKLTIISKACGKVK